VSGFNDGDDDDKGWNNNNFVSNM